MKSDTVLKKYYCYISPPEAIYRIFGFHMFDVSPSVLLLQLHLPNMNTVAFKACDNLEAKMISTARYAFHIPTYIMPHTVTLVQY
jgi:hypothetical protein